MLGELTVKDFMSTLASSAPVPGGGSAAALAGSTACSLISMVAGLTMDKSGYEDVWDEMREIKQIMDDKSQAFLAEMDRDADSYAKVIGCYQMPKNTDEEKANRSKAIQEAILEAAKIPLEVAELASELFAYARTVIQKGNQNAASDGAVGALMARACIRGALYNVKINAVSLKNETARELLLSRSSELEALADNEEQETLHLMSFE
jgi:formiminotetrahydrofolate cyclodeaminase